MLLCISLMYMLLLLNASEPVAEFSTVSSVKLLLQVFQCTAGQLHNIKSKTDQEEFARKFFPSAL